jgi:two-component system response regulator FlrC
MVMERAGCMGSGPTIDARDIADAIAMGVIDETGGPGAASPTPPGEAPTLAEALRETERRAILEALTAAAGHRGRAAARLGLSEASLYRRLARLATPLPRDGDLRSESRDSQI